MTPRCGIKFRVYLIEVQIYLVNQKPFTRRQERRDLGSH